MSNEVYDGELAKKVGIHHVERLEHCFVDILSQRPKMGAYLLNAGPTLRFVVKLFSPDGLDELRREEELSRVLSGLKLPVTETIAAPQSPEVGSTPYRMSRFIEGYDLDEGLLTGRIDDGVVPDIVRKYGERVAQVHASAGEGAFGEFANPADRDWKETLSRRSTHALELLSNRVFDGCDDQSIATVRERSERESDLCVYDGPRCLILGDLHPKHIIVEESEYEYHLNGILGLRKAFYGDPAWDLARMDRVLFEEEPRLRDPFLEGYASIRPLPEGWESRRDSCQFFDRLLVVADSFANPSDRSEAWSRIHS